MIEVLKILAITIIQAYVIFFLVMSRDPEVKQEVSQALDAEMSGRTYSLSKKAKETEEATNLIFYLLILYILVEKSWRIAISS